MTAELTQDQLDQLDELEILLQTTKVLYTKTPPTLVSMEPRPIKIIFDGAEIVVDYYR